MLEDLYASPCPTHKLSVMFVTLVWIRFTCERKKRHRKGKGDFVIKDNRSQVFWTAASTATDSHYNADLESLLAFKEHTTDPYGVLAANWSTNTSFCDWVGVRCSHRRRRVVTLNLTSFSLQGTISPYLGNLSFLRGLDLGNNTLTGPIPESLGHLPRLQEIVLEQNHLSGPIPRSFFNMSLVVGFYLATNNLTGSLPSNGSLVMLPHLQYMSIADNRLTGQIPSIFASCFNLRVLDTSANEFTGAIPVELGTITNLEYLSLQSNNLGDAIPTSLGNLTQLQGLYLNINRLGGRIPETIGNLQNLKELYLHRNRLTGAIPTSLFNASMLQVVSLSFNNLTGSIPITHGESVPQLTTLLMSRNQLTGGLDFIASLSNCKNLLQLEVEGNKLAGVIPDSIGNLSTNLQRFNIIENGIGGSIPTGLGNLSNLYFLDLRGNKLSGTIPLALTSLRKLQALVLAANRISGSIPSELGLMTSLMTLDVGMNLLTGPIPASIGNLSKLLGLSLSNNALSSSIPVSLGGLSNLVTLLLHENNLNGTLPSGIGNMETLDTLDMHMNRLSGNLSTALGKLQMLTYLDLSSNVFQGQIPESIGRVLVNIEYLNLSHNAFTDAIPKSLATLRYLASLDLSSNNLEGQIPEGRVFSNISIPSLRNNPGLCGAPTLSFPPCSPITKTSTSRSKSRRLVYALPSTAFFSMLLACLYLLLRSGRRNKVKSPTDHCDDALDLNKYGRISHHELVRATDNFSDANLLGRGGLGSVFKACLDDGLVFAVKVFNLEVQEGFRSFDAECQVLRMVRHRNLVKVIGACSNLDFKALILPLMVNGSLEKWLYSNEHCLSLHQRLNIMIDVSLALEYLHHRHGNVVLHCDLKPSNVLLDEDMVAHLSDFGIAKLLLGDGKSSTLTRTTGTIGYIAPECGSSGKVSRKSDVYSFGILLLEIFTRKGPTNEMFKEELSLRQWVSNAYPATLLEIVDSDLFRDNSVNMQHGEEVLTSFRQAISSVMELGLSCSRELPMERMSMEDVVSRLQNIRKECSQNFQP